MEKIDDAGDITLKLTITHSPDYYYLDGIAFTECSDFYFGGKSRDYYDSYRLLYGSSDDCVSISDTEHGEMLVGITDCTPESGSKACVVCKCDDYCTAICGEEGYETENCWGICNNCGSPWC
jgi:hypothetical protein